MNLRNVFLAVVSVCVLAGFAGAGVISDDFSGGSLNPAWTWDDPNANDTYNLTDRSGWLTVKLATGNEDTWTTRGTAPILRTNTSTLNYATDFSVESYVDIATGNGGTPGTRNIGAVCLYSNTVGNCVLSLGLQYWNKLTFEFQRTGTGTIASVTTDVKSGFVKMDYDAETTTWTASYKKTAGDDWTSFGTYVLPMTSDIELGLITKSWSSGTAGYVQYDYFKVSQVPEPSTFALMVCGLIGLVAYAWRKRR